MYEFRSSRRFLIVIVCIFVILEAVYGYYDTDTTLRLIRIEEKLDILSNEVNRMRDTDSVETEHQELPLEPVTLVSVERTPGLEANMFTLNFTRNVPEIYFAVTIEDHILASGTEAGEVKESSSLSFTCDGLCEGMSMVDVTFSNMSRSSEVRLKLNNQGTEPSVQSSFNAPKLEVLHNGDLVYDKGRDVSVKISSSYGEDRGFSSLGFSFSAVMSDGEGSYTTSQGDRWTEKVETKTFFDTQESVFEISTSEHPASGLINVSLTFNDEEWKLVREYKVERFLVVRPSNQSGPYPQDYLQFPVISRLYENQPVQRYCKLGSNCSASCSAEGSITDIQVKQLDTEDEQWEPLTNLTKTDFDFSITAQWTVLTTNTSEDMKFQCVAMAASTNKTLDIELKFYTEEFYIDGNRSNIEVLTNQSSPGEGSAVVNCAIVGRPVTNVYFYLLYGDSEYYHYHPVYFPGQVQLTSPTESLATVTVDFDGYRMPLEGFVGAHCAARSIKDKEDDYVMTWTPVTMGQ